MLCFLQSRRLGNPAHIDCIVEDSGLPALPDVISLIELRPQQPTEYGVTDQCVGINRLTEQTRN